MNLIHANGICCLSHTLDYYYSRLKHDYGDWDGLD